MTYYLVQMEVMKNHQSVLEDDLAEKMKVFWLE